MAYQLINGRFQAFTDAGAFAVGYQLYTYDSGTTTPKATYTDATLSSVNTNPVVLDARGEAQVWLGSGAYTFVLTDASGVTVWTVDGVIDTANSLAAALSLPSGAGMVKFNPQLAYVPDAIGWYLNNTTPAIVANWFGITGDGVTNWTTQIQAVINLAAAAKRNVMFLNGTYITGSLNMVDKRIGIIGESTLGTIINAPAGFTGTLINMLNTTNNGGDTFETIERLTLQGVYGVGSVALDQNFCSRSVFRDARVQGFDIGVRRVNCFCMLDENVEINDCRVGIHLVGSNHNSSHIRCSYVGAGLSWGGTGECVRITNNGADMLQSALTFRDCDFEFGGANADGVVAAMTGTLLLVI